ncbi:MAG TPA: serine/threonine-protein kinase, partial [Kofleriaceae bacterium]|nr:serine/threonine-protein kinase [Kofleriaceae bacterium]
MVRVEPGSSQPAPASTIEPDAPALRAAFERETAAVNVRRLRVIAPVMIAVHAIHIWVFGAAAAQRSLITDAMLRSLTGLVRGHAAMVPVAVIVTAVVYLPRRAVVAPLLGPALATLYLVHGAICTAYGLVASDSVSTYVGYCYGLAVVLCLTPRVTVAAYCIGLLALMGSLATIAPSLVTFVAALPTCAGATAVAVALVWILHGARWREFRQRATIEHQRDQLGALNADLEHRVQTQVGEIVARAAEVEQLNALLQAQVRARSSGLALALARLTQRPCTEATLRGAVLGDRFVLGALLGVGGMGAVYAGVDRATGARVAIKVVLATSTRTLDALRRFAREAGAAAAVAHPAVVRVIDIDISDDGLLYQVQELVDGEPLSRWAGRAWNPGDAARLGAVLCDALAAAHAAGVIHRDVKPENLMLTTAAPGLKLLDFGIAKLHAAVHRQAGDATTRTGMIIGTPAYMAPEQVLGAREVNDRADVYAAGAILFSLLSERRPFEAESPQAAMTSRLLHDAPGVRTFQPAVPESLA